MFQDEGASTAKTGIWVVSRAETTERKGSRTSPVKLKPAHVSLSERVGQRLGYQRSRLLRDLLSSETTQNLP